MSHRYDVLRALGDLFRVVLPRAEVLGVDDDGDNADEVGRDGRVIVRSGDPGEPIVDLSPLTYNWAHRIPVEAVFRSETDLDAAVTLLGEAIVANRQLGGLCEWLDILAPATEGLFAEGASIPRAAAITVIAMYPTTSPTG